jgi:nucleotide-binding universal stress UspA family protein
MINLQRILVPTDFSLHSQKALTYAAAFAEKFGAELFVLHVFQDLAVFQPDAVAVGPPVMPPVEELAAAARTSLQRVIQEQNFKGFKVTPEVREGSPFDEIVDFAKEKNIDLIIMGTHGRGWLAHVLLGSVTQKVIRKSPCPVLTVHHPEHEFVQP